MRWTDDLDKPCGGKSLIPVCRAYVSVGEVWFLLGEQGLDALGRLMGVDRKTETEQHWAQFLDGLTGRDLENARSITAGLLEDMLRSLKGRVVPDHRITRAFQTERRQNPPLVLAIVAEATPADGPVLFWRATAIPPNGAGDDVDFDSLERSFARYRDADRYMRDLAVLVRGG
jgi:hypothetical protein